MDPVPQKKYAATVSAVETLAQGVNRFTFKLDTPFTYVVAQYVWVEIPELKIQDPKGNRRSFSICSLSDESNSVSIIARTSDSGYKQTLFALSVGDAVLVHGPFGSAFVLEYNTKKNIIMIAGGVGIAPFLPVVQYIKRESLPLRTHLVYTNNDKKATAFLPELKAVKSRNKMFSYDACYEQFSWERVQEVYAELGKDTAWWISGPQGMVDHVYAELERSGVSLLDMVFETYYPTGKNTLTRDQVRAQLSEDNIFARAIQNATSHSIITDSEGTVLFANKAAVNITGYSEEEILGNTPRLWGGMMSHEFYVDFWKRKMSGESFRGEIINRRKNGDIYHAIAHIAPILGDDKSIIGFIGTEEDITDLKMAEQEIVARSEELDAFFNSTKEIMGIANTDGYFVRVNPTLVTLLGYEASALSAQPFVAFVHPDDVAPTNREVAKLAEGAATVNFVNRFRKHDGTYVSIQWNATPQGKQIFASGRDITQDIAARQLMEEKNHELEQINKQMVNRELRMIELKEQLARLRGNTAP